MKVWQGRCGAPTSVSETTVSMISTLMRLDLQSVHFKRILSPRSIQLMRLICTPGVGVGIRYGYLRSLRHVQASM